MKREIVHIIKVGGNVIEDQFKLDEFLSSLAALKGKKILVHGGGKEATVLAETMGVEVQMMEGRRITDDAMIRIVTMVYAGLINKRIVAKLHVLNCACIGLTGADANLILSDKRPLKNGIDYGWVGDPKAVNTDFLIHLLDENIMPILAPLTHDGKGNLLNTNADTIATVVASALAKSFEVHQVFAFELPGVMEDINRQETVIRRITKKNYEQLKSDNVVREGMIPKLDNAFDAIDKGVDSVRIIHFGAIGKLGDPNFDEYTTIA